MITTYTYKYVIYILSLTLCIILSTILYTGDTDCDEVTDYMTPTQSKEIEDKYRASVLTLIDRVKATGAYFVMAGPGS